MTCDLRSAKISNVESVIQIINTERKMVNVKLDNEALIFWQTRRGSSTPAPPF